MLKLLHFLYQAIQCVLLTYYDFLKLNIFIYCVLLVLELESLTNDYQIEKNNGYTVVLLNIVASDQIDIHLRQSAAIAIKRLTRSNWSENIITVFDEEGKLLV